MISASFGFATLYRLAANAMTTTPSVMSATMTMGNDVTSPNMFPPGALCRLFGVRRSCDRKLTPDDVLHDDLFPRRDLLARGCAERPRHTCVRDGYAADLPGSDAERATASLTDECRELERAL
jgi:hypothetical protein